MAKVKSSSKDQKKYIIYRIDETNSKNSICFPKKIVLQKFFAANDAEAYKYLKDYKKVANKAYTYYYAEEQEYAVINDDGTKSTYADIHEMHEDWLKDRNIWEKLKSAIYYR